MPSEIEDTPGGWGRNIAAARTRLGLTQQQLAERHGGVVPNTVARWEQGRHPSSRDQRRLAAVLETTVTELFPRTDDEAELVALAAALGNGCS